jgi:hypothetical protein
MVPVLLAGVLATTARRLPFRSGVGVAGEPVGAPLPHVAGDLVQAEAVRGDPDAAYRAARRNVGRAVLLGLEVLIIADIVLTVTIDPTIERAVALAVIVLVRTFLSFSLEIELEGEAPWRRRRGRADRS